MRSLKPHPNSLRFSWVSPTGLALGLVLAILCGDEAAAQQSGKLTVDFQCKSQTVSLPPGVHTVRFDRSGRPACVCADSRNEIVSYLMEVGRRTAEKQNLDGVRRPKSRIDSPVSFIDPAEYSGPFGSDPRLKVGQEHRIQLWCYPWAEVRRYRAAIRKQLQ
jgi:hypothetical protein